MTYPEKNSNEHQSDIDVMSQFFAHQIRFAQLMSEAVLANQSFWMGPPGVAMRPHGNTPARPKTVKRTHSMPV
ncbi:hypothetical protein SAMN05421666_0109 [Roseovarius nanhaiticus]|uniref:Uncharacterized protein n=1 Tax=Roseovarius nanhaiticus TaxID=573024 RepID=A0A1N7EBU6_9RHOB|nr:hypothetical protein [Roseovarius nanhaiticus]SEK77958.1 hypothetical protein SAMN05216208_2025 [Roseovarius nanhaiticus]SIR85520.1 hypothetical protein SAMN05421666_0109 [Roseovarius nanhaiticus]